jgi:hypothetical protein
MDEPLIELSSIRSGDLLAWKQDDFSWFSDTAMGVVKKLTKTPWGHVGIAWKVNDGLSDRLMVIEATIPEIQVALVDPRQEVFCVPANIAWTRRGRHFLMDKIGYPYSLSDAIRGLLGKRLNKDTSWQCAELAHGYYEVEGLHLPPDYTPAGIIKNLMIARRSLIYRVMQFPMHPQEAELSFAS